ncbi:MAG: AAA family ATPase [Halieaceae bacterium]|jgi:general secretion pathway protein A|nr:AAA family ATPase [Halieaceae bacterium]
MYHQYFGLTEAPFSIAVNPRYLFMSPRHRDALAHLLYGVGAGGGFILLTGEVGTGKTTINRCLLEQLPDDTDIAIILNPALNAMELLATVCDELGIAYDNEKHTLKTLTDSLHRYLLENHRRARKTVLLIDEAQHLDFDVLEQIRLLTNLETNSEKLLQIILIGQPELAQMLGRPELRQLNQRITARYNLEPLSLEETGAYIRHRLQVAGMNPGQEVFPPAVIRGIHRYTRGIPRLINVLCDRMMLGAYGRNMGRTDIGMLRTAATEVMGEEAAGSRDEPGRFWPLAAVAGLLVALAAGWWWQNRQVPPPAASADTAANEMPVAAGPTAEPPAAVVEPEPAAASAETVVAPALPGSAVAEAAAASPRWLLAPQQAWSRLWSLYSPAPVPDLSCNGQVQDGLACVEGTAQTWDELATLDRPLLLDMITPERFAAGSVFLGSNGRSAWFATGSGVIEVQLAELGPAWTGRYRLLWHPPPGFVRPLAIGDNSPAVARVAELFARLDGQPQALAGNRFNPALETRVRLFQRKYALQDDGVVGIQTLLKLNEALGIDPTSAAARDLLARDPDEVVTR